MLGTALVHYPTESRQVHFEADQLSSFQLFLERLAEQQPSGSDPQPLTHCAYEDEEGDRVTVRSSEEVAALGRLLLASPVPVHVFPVAEPGETPSERRPKGRPRVPPPPLRIETSLSPGPAPAEDVHVLAEVLEAEDADEAALKRLLDECPLRPEALRNLSVLGHGHCGTVYKAMDTDRDRLMAVKCVSLDVGPELQSAILNELRILHKCSSPYVVEFYGAMFVETQMSICIEYMDGGSLDSYGALPENVLAQLRTKIGFEVAVAAIHGLSYLWSQRIMHRDVKPSNMLINSKGEMKLADFGVSAQLENSITASYVGTNAYMAPERVVGGAYRVASDIWALGLSLAELALGRFPLEAGADDPLALAQLLLEPDPLPLPPDLPASTEFRHLMRDCLAKRAEERVQPGALLLHPYVRANGPVRHHLLADWLRSRAANTPKAASSSS